MAFSDRVPSAWKRPSNPWEWFCDAMPALCFGSQAYTWASAFVSPHPLPSPPQDENLAAIEVCEETPEHEHEEHLLCFLRCARPNISTLVNVPPTETEPWQARHVLRAFRKIAEASALEAACHRPSTSTSHDWGVPGFILD